MWPENWPAFELFAALRTQWRTSMAGYTGLDYTAVLAVMDAYGTPAEERRDLLDDVHVMELAALAELRAPQA